MPLEIGSDDELQSRLRNFDENITKQKQDRRRHEAERQDFEDELTRARRTHVGLVNEHGELAAEAKVRTCLPCSNYFSNNYTSYYRHTIVV